MTPLFETRALTLRIGAQLILDRISLELPRGRVIALIGHNGSGKSSLLKVLARQVSPSEGTVTHSGRPLADWSPRESARALAYLPQYTPAAEGMTVRDLVALGRYPWHGALGRQGAQDRAAIASAMHECGVTPFAARLVDTLSGGERQRVWLAMMLAQEAKTLLLDEPISALDIAHQVEVMRLIGRLALSGRSVLVVLHDVNMAARFCDHVVALKAGRVVLNDAVPALMTPEMLEHIYGLPMDIAPRADGTRLAWPV